MLSNSCRELDLAALLEVAVFMSPENDTGTRQPTAITPVCWAIIRGNFPG